MRAAVAELQQGLGGGRPYVPFSRHGPMGLPVNPLQHSAWKTHSPAGTSAEVQATIHDCSSPAEVKAVVTIYGGSSPAVAGGPGALREAAPGSATAAAAQVGRT